MSSYIIKHVKLVRTFLYLAWKQMLEYKFAFYTSFLRQLIIMAIWIAFWRIIIGGMTSVQGWTFEALSVFVGYLLFLEGFWSIFFPVMRIGDTIRKGQIDVFLTKPMNPVFGLVLRRMYISDTMGMLLGLGIISYVSISSGVETVALRLGLAVIMAMGATAISVMVYAFVGLLTFWLGEVAFLRDALVSFDVADYYPTTVFPSLIQYFLTFVIPTIFFATYPALLTMQYTFPTIARIFALEALIFVIWFAILRTTYHFGVRRYESFGG